VGVDAKAAVIDEVVGHRACVIGRGSGLAKEALGERGGVGRLELGDGSVMIAVGRYPRNAAFLDMRSPPTISGAANAKTLPSGLRIGSGEYWTT
jgi:hypothetical protein